MLPISPSVISPALFSFSHFRCGAFPPPFSSSHFRCGAWRNLSHNVTFSLCSPSRDCILIGEAFAILKRVLKVVCSPPSSMIRRFFGLRH